MWYILNENNKPIKVSGIEYAMWEKNPTKRIVKKDTIEDIRISTVFLGLDHAFKSDTPILWETMIFGGEYDNYQERYTSYEDALIGHQKALDLIK